MARSPVASALSQRSRLSNRLSEKEHSNHAAAGNDHPTGYVAIHQAVPYRDRARAIASGPAGNRSWPDASFAAR
jgi:hypothetical protein